MHKASFQFANSRSPPERSAAISFQKHGQKRETGFSHAFDMQEMTAFPSILAVFALTTGGFCDTITIPKMGMEGPLSPDWEYGA